MHSVERGADHLTTNSPGTVCTFLRLILPLPIRIPNSKFEAFNCFHRVMSIQVHLFVDPGLFDYHTCIPQIKFVLSIVTEQSVTSIKVKRPLSSLSRHRTNIGKLTRNFQTIWNIGRENLTGPGLAPETSGLPYRYSFIWAIQPLDGGPPKIVNQCGGGASQKK